MEDPTYSQEVPLTRTNSILRKKVVDNVSYDCTLVLNKGSSYSGEVTIQFDVKDMKDEGRTIFIDFRGKKVMEISVNGQ